jgi:hypothetical protein
VTFAETLNNRSNRYIPQKAVSNHIEVAIFSIQRAHAE